MSTTNKLLEKLAAAKQSIQARTGNYGEKPVRLTSPKNVIRVLPHWSDPNGESPHQDFGMHWIKDSQGKVVAGFVCTQISLNEQCDVCDQLATAALNNTDEATAELIKEAKAKGRVLVNAIYRNGQHTNAKTDPVMLELPATVFDSILTIANEYLQDHGINIFDLKEGYDLTVTKTGSGRNTEYNVVIAPRATPVDDDTYKKAKDLNAWVRAEYERAKARALPTMRAALSGNALPARGQGALPAPSAPRSNLASARPVDLDEDVIEGEATPVATPARAARPAPAPAPAATDDAVLDELEDLLNS